MAALVEAAPASMTLDAWALPHAERLRAMLPSNCTVFDDSPSRDVLMAAWDRAPASALLTGTSHYAPFEQTLWQIAAKRSVPTLAVLDQWMNIAPRFTAAQPDFIGVLDRGQRPDVRALGFSDEHIIEIGHPWLARLARSRQPDADASAVGARVLFASEPIRQDVAQGVNAPFGFDEFDALKVVHDAAAAVARSGMPVTLVVKCHPYEDAAAFHERLNGLGSVDRLTIHLLDGRASALDAIHEADLVTGVSSMLLLEAMVLGRAVISVQPGLSREETFVPSLRAAARTLTNPATAHDVLTALIAGDDARSVERARHAGFVNELAGDPGPAFRQWLSRVGFGGAHGSV